VIELSHVSKTYAPRLGAAARAVDDVSLRVLAGEVAGIAGPAGAGKSTIIAMVLGLTRPTTGTVLLDGVDPRRFVEREGIGYLPDRLALPSRWRVGEALQRLAILSGVPAAAMRERVDAVVGELELGPSRNARLRSLSADLRKRLGIAQALVAGRRVVVLDEPFEGLSDDSRARFPDLVERLRAPDRAILIASRDLDDVRRVADNVTVIDRGRVRRVSPPRATPADDGTLFHLVVYQGAERVREVFPSAVSLGRSAFAVRTSGLAELNRGLRDLLDAGALLASVAPARLGAERHASPVTTEVV
jgi:ABC-type multidrug transport system ATPase subunit